MLYQKINHVLILLLVVGVLFGCGKERTFHVKAQNPATGEPYDGLRVVVTSSRTAWNGEKYKTEHDGHLDSNGEAMINVKVKTGRTYSVQCEQPPNTCYTKDIQLYLKDHDEKNPSFLFEYAECAYLKLKIENINCQGPEDEIYYKRTWLSKNTSGNGVIQEGCFNYEGDFFELAEGEYLYEWEVTRNGNTTYHDSVFSINKGDSYTFLLEY